MIVAWSVRYPRTPVRGMFIAEVEGKWLGILAAAFTLISAVPYAVAPFSALALVFAWAFAANKHRGIIAVSCTDRLAARVSREHMNANFLCIGVHGVAELQLSELVRVWLGTAFAGGRHERRVNKALSQEGRS